MLSGQWKHFQIEERLKTIQKNIKDGNVSTLESGEYSLLENSNPQFTELPSPAGTEVINKNISYDFLVTLTGIRH